jgi:hypothetical protein
MAELEPGHPDELLRTLRNWLNQAQSPLGSFPSGTDPLDWVVRQFIDGWREPARDAIDSIEQSLNEAMALCDSGAAPSAIKAQIDIARQTLQEDLRDHLGLYDWNKD